MSAGGRARTRERVLRRAALIAGVLVLLALLLFISGHWVLGVIVGDRRRCRDLGVLAGADRALGPGSATADP